MPSILKRKLPLVRVVLTLVGVLLVILLFRNLSLDIFLRPLANPFLLAVALLMPYTITFFLDAIAWSQLFPRSLPVRVGKLAFIRFVSEPFTLTLPGGAVIGESLKAGLVKSTYGISFPEAGASVLLYRFGLGVSQIVFVAFGLLLGYPELELQSVRIIGREGLGDFAVLAALSIAVILAGLLLFVNWFQPGRRLFTLKSVSSGSSRKERWVQIIQGIQKSEATIITQFKEHKLSFLFTLVLFFFGWMSVVVETYLMAHTLGIPLTLDQAFVVESVASMFRFVGFLLPSGIGGQDWAYTALLSVYAVQDQLALGASFAVLKRIREAAWIGLGFLTLSVTLGGKAVRTTLDQSSGR